MIKANGTGAKRLAKDVVLDDHKGPAWTSDSSGVIYVKRDFERSNPIMWAKVTSNAKGTLLSDTLMNSDLSIFHKKGGVMQLAFRSVGLKGSVKKTWQRIYVVTFTMDDLR